MYGSGISSPVLYNLKQAKFTLSKLSVTHVQKKKKKLICELSVQCELHNDLTTVIFFGDFIVDSATLIDKGTGTVPLLTLPMNLADLRL